MLDYAREAVDLARGRVREDLESDRMFNLSLTRLVEVFGEAASFVSNESRATYPAIPWRNIADMRNRLIHGYSEVDCDVLWTTIHNDLPPLIVQLQEIVGHG